MSPARGWVLRNDAHIAHFLSHFLALGLMPTSPLRIFYDFVILAGGPGAGRRERCPHRPGFGNASDWPVDVWGGMDVRIVLGRWSLTPFCLLQDLRMEPCRPILIFVPASCLAPVCPPPRSKNFSNALPGLLKHERNCLRIHQWPTWAV